MRFRLALISAALAAVPVVAQEQGAPEKFVSGSMGVDFTTAYFFRGIVQENQGVISQPWVELGYNLHSADEGLKSVDLVFGVWNSLHDGPTGGAGGIWYESDFYASLNTRLGDRFTAGATYTVYHSPNATFGTVEELAFSVGFDDTGLLSDSFALKPNLVVAFELDGQADAGSHVGTYGQIGVEPAFAVGKLGDLDITVSVPVTIGLSLSDYYEYGTGDDDFLGFVDIGIAATSPLPFLPARLGPWSGTLALHALLLGDNNETAHHGDANAFVLSFGLSTTF